MVDYYGTELDLNDAEQTDRLVFNHIDDTLRVLHASCCPEHNTTIDPNGSVTLLAEEVRAVCFAIPTWIETLGAQDKMLPELDGIIADLNPSALANNAHTLSVPHATVLLSSLMNLDLAMQMYRNLLTLMGFFQEEE